MVSKVEVTYLYTHSSPALSFGLYIFCVVNPYPDPGTRLWPIEVAEQGVLPYCICHKVGNRRRFPLVARSLYPELRRKFCPADPCSLNRDRANKGGNVRPAQFR